MDSVRKSNVSQALWISLIWMMYSAAKPISFWFAGGVQDRSDPLEGRPLDRRILSVLLFLSVIVLIKRRVLLLDILKKNKFVVLWFIYCGVSILWSDFPTVSFKRWIKQIGLLLSVLLVLTENDPILAIKTLFKRFSYIIIPFSIILIMFVPEIGVSYSLVDGSISYQGVSWGKNGLGRICMISSIFFFWNLVTIKRIKKLSNNEIQLFKKEKVFIQYLFLAMSTALLIFVNSATSFAGFIMGLFIIVGLGYKPINRNIKNLEMFLFIGFIIGLALQLSFDLIGMFIKSLGRDVTFTGRTFLWSDLVAFRTNPLTGVGYGSFWMGKRLAILWEKYVWLPNESHNGYLNIYLELGILGLFILAGIIIITFRNIRKALIYNFDYARLGMVIIFIAIIYNIMEDAFGKVNLIWFVFLLVAFDMPQKPAYCYSSKSDPCDSIIKGNP